MKNYYILDTETTVLTPRTGALLSVAAIYVVNYTPVDHIEVIINHSESDLLTLCRKEVVEMHKKSGLWDKVISSTTSLADAQQQMLEFIKKHSIPKQRNILIGNSIHFDKDWLQQHMPVLARQFYYRMIDVSSLNLLMREFQPEIANIVQSNKVWGHTALADCYETLKELRLYIDKVIKK